VSEPTNKKIHKLQIYKETYDIDVKKDLNESNSSSVAYVHNRTHYLNNPLVITLPYKNGWSYSLKPELSLKPFKPDLSLKPNVDYVIQFELVNNTGALVSRIFQYDGSLNFSYSFTFSYLDTKTNEVEDLKLVIKTDGVTLDVSEASDQLKAQLKAEPLKINIIKASDITKLPNAYLNIAFDPNEEDKNDALLATKTSIDVLNLKHNTDIAALQQADEAIKSKHDADVTELQEADEANLKEAKQYTDDKVKAESDQRQEVDNKLIEAVHSIANIEQIDDTDSGILCINPYNVIPKT
jgi:hypothetical protein